MLFLYFKYQNGLDFFEKGFIFSYAYVYVFLCVEMRISV